MIGPGFALVLVLVCGPYPVSEADPRRLEQMQPVWPKGSGASEVSSEVVPVHSAMPI